MPKKFTRTVEDFTCENCQVPVSGNGYTNHCPNCLWSKHVDVNPGDRMAACRGLMKPESVELRDSTYTIVHCCTSCGHRKKNKSQSEDNFEALLRLAREGKLR